MARKVFEDFTQDFSNSEQNSNNNIKISLNPNDTQRVELPDSDFVKDSDISRDGMDLVLETDNGTVIVEGYFAVEPTPNLYAPDGTALTPKLVDAFTRGGNEYADSGMMMNDESPVGAIQEISGNATVTRADGTVIQSAGIGTPIYQGDIVETSEDGAVNIMFVDETTFAVSEDARLAIDEYVFDPATQSGTSNFSVLKGVFVFTSGLIGRDDPDDVSIETPSGSIGIRGTIIAGDVDAGEITVIEGAIVLHDLAGNSITLADQFETARFDPAAGTIEHMGNLGADDVSSKFMSISTVAGDLFSSIQDAGAETGQDNNSGEANDAQSDTNAEDGVDASSDTQNDDAAEDSAPETQDATTDGEQQQQGEETEAQGESEAEATQNAESTDNAEAAQTQDGQTASEPAPQDVVTSSDITGSENKAPAPTSTTQQTITETKPAPAPTTQQTTPTSSGETQTQQTQQPPPTQQQSPPETFNVQLNYLAFNENDDGADVLRVTGQNTDGTSLDLLGISQNFYDITQEDANTFLISLKSGVSMDAENPHPVRFRATDSDGQSEIVRSASLNVQDINEGINFIGNSSNDFTVTEYSQFEYDFSKDFHDPEGSMTFSISGVGTTVDMVNYNFDANTGVLTFEMDAAIGTPTSGLVTIVATDDNGNSTSHDYDFESISTSDGSSVFGAGTYHLLNDTEYLTHDNLTLYADSGTNSKNITISGINNVVKTGNANDTITVSSATTNNYELHGNDGNDTFDLNSVNGFSYGGHGNDHFLIHNEVGQLETLSSGAMKIDGGAGFDLLHISTADNIDFSNVENGIINNIEKIAFINSQANTITLDYQSVINMTDGNNTLFVDMDAGDNLIFDHSSTSNEFVHHENVSINGETYDMYTDGHVTVYADPTGTTTEIAGL